MEYSVTESTTALVLPAQESLEGLLEEARTSSPGVGEKGLGAVCAVEDWNIVNKGEGSEAQGCSRLISQQTTAGSLTCLDRIRAVDLPRRLGRYELQSILGRGGMATVFGAELFGPAGFRKPVAIKVIRSKAFGQAASAAAEAFVREARLGGLLKHPNIVDVYEFGEAEGQSFISMERLEALTLYTLMRSVARPPAAVVLEIAVAIVAGLASAHSLRTDGLKAGLVHRDLKPSNVLVSWDGAVKVMDFGIATTEYGELASGGQAFSMGRGTPSYMSPEQMLLEPVDGRSDLFSFGLLLTELAAGGFLPRDVLYNRLKAGGSRCTPVVTEQTLSDVDRFVPGLRPILVRCLQPFAQGRYPTAGALLADLSELRERSGIQPPLQRWLADTFARTEFQGADTNAVLHHIGGLETVGEDGVGGQAKQNLLPTTLILKTSGDAKTNLVRPLDGYVGRVTELYELGKYFGSETRLVTVKGTGGAGKTRFARRYARAQADLLPGGAWFVDLTEARSPKGLVHATAMALEVPLAGEGIDGLVAQVGHAIAGRGPMLLVLDNFEQVVEHAAGTLGRWLTMAPEARFLVTSRESLKLSGEQVFSLQPLPKSEGVELFRMRAKAAGATWQETEQARAAIMGVVDELDGLPLAIELAAVRTRMLTPVTLLERLTERFKLLSGGRRGDSARQSSLRGLMDWSWELLEPWEQSALAQLSVFHDGFFMDAAEAVLDLSGLNAPWSMDVVGSLLDKSLLHSQEVQGQPRFGMYRSIQEYAGEKLGDESAKTALRHAQHFALLGEEWFIESLDTPKGGGRRKLLALELENLLVGVEVGLASDSPQTAAGCALASGELFKMYGPYSEGIKVLRRVNEHVVCRNTKARLFGVIAPLLRQTGSASEGLAYNQKALAIHREENDRRNEGRALGCLALTLDATGCVKESIEHYQQALAIAREVSDRRGEARSQGNLATAYHHQGRLQEALEGYQRTLVIHREMGNRRSEAVTLGNLAWLYGNHGSFSKAAGYYQEVLAAARETGNRRNEGVNLTNYGALLFVRGYVQEGMEHTRQALVVHREAGDRRGESLVLGNLGDMLFAQGELREAEAHLLQAIPILDDIWTVAAGVFRATLALIRGRQGLFAEARALLSLAESQVRPATKAGLAALLCKKARVEYLAGDKEAALTALSEAEAIGLELGRGLPSELEGAPSDSELGKALAEVQLLLAGSAA